VTAPVSHSLDELMVQPLDEAATKTLLVEFEFNSLGRRLFGEEFKAGRGGKGAEATQAPSAPSAAAEATPAPSATLKTIKDTQHEYHLAQTPEERAALIQQLLQQPSFCFDTETSSLDEQTAELAGLAFSWQAHTGWYVPVPPGAAGRAVLQEFQPV